MTPGTLKAYIVVLSFEAPPSVNVSTWVAPDAHSASALAMRQLMLGENATDSNFMCVTVEMPADMLRYYLRAVEGKLPDSGNAEVLHLVPSSQYDQLRQVPASELFAWERGGQPLDEMPWVIDTIGWSKSKPKYWGHDRYCGAIWIYDEQFGPPNPSNEWSPPGAA